MFTSNESFKNSFFPLLDIRTHCIFHKACSFCLYISPSCSNVGSQNHWVVASDRNHNISIHGLARLLVLFSSSEPDSSLAVFENWVGWWVAFDLSQVCIVLPLRIPKRITNPWRSSFCCPELLPVPCIQSMHWQDSLKLDEEWLLLAIFSFGTPKGRRRWESPSCPLHPWSCCRLR